MHMSYRVVYVKLLDSGHTFQVGILGSVIHIISSSWKVGDLASSPD